MELEIRALAEHLGIDPSLISSEEDNIYEDTQNNEYYYVFKNSTLSDLIIGSIYEEQCDKAEEELEHSTRYDVYKRYFTIDYDSLKDYCFEDIEGILGTEERESIDIEGEFFVILKIN